MEIKEKEELISKIINFKKWRFENV